MIRINLKSKLPKGSFYGWTEYHVDILDQTAVIEVPILRNIDPERPMDIIVKEEDLDIDRFHIEN